MLGLYRLAQKPWHSNLSPLKATKADPFGCVLRTYQTSMCGSQVHVALCGDEQLHDVPESLRLMYKERDADFAVLYSAGTHHTPPHVICILFLYVSCGHIRPANLLHMYAVGWHCLAEINLLGNAHTTQNLLCAFCGGIGSANDLGIRRRFMLRMLSS